MPVRPEFVQDVLFLAPYLSIIQTTIKHEKISDCTPLFALFLCGPFPNGRRLPNAAKRRGGPAAGETHTRR
jgi:hypothetical protein